MFVNCLFYKDEAQGYSGRAYTYRTELPLKVGDKVLLPVRGDEPKRGMVVMVHLNEPKFPCSEITEMDAGEG